MSKAIIKADKGLCDCCQSKSEDNIPTLYFESNDEEYVSFEICAECFIKLLNKLKDGEPTKLAEVKTILKEGN